MALLMMQSMQNTDSDEGSDFGFDPMQMMQGMFTPEQQGMFDMYNSMFSTENETSETKTLKKEV